MDPTYPLFPIFAFLCSVLVLIPLPWHIHAWNFGTCLYMIWTALGLMNLFINSIIWRDNAIDSSPLWCDISTRIVVGVSVAIPAASLCINRRLYKIASGKITTVTLAHKRRAVMTDLAIGLGLPVLQMGLQYIVQGHRYDIWEEVGCYPDTVNTPPAYPLSFLWPIIISITSSVYCVLTLREFIKRRAQFTQLISSAPSLTVSRYFRLMALAMTEIVFNLPISIYGLYFNIVSSPIYPWQGWANIHFDYFFVGTFPALLWRSNTASVVNLEFSRWALVVSALVFFGFFGFADEARKNYRSLYWTAAKRFGAIPPSQRSISGKISTSSKNSGYLTSTTVELSLPVFVLQPLQLTSTARTSVSSLNDQTSYFKSEYTETLNQSPIYSEYKTDILPPLPSPPLPPLPPPPPSPPLPPLPSTGLSSHSTCNLPQINLPKRPHSSVY